MTLEYVMQFLFWTRQLNSGCKTNKKYEKININLQLCHMEISTIKLERCYVNRKKNMHVRADLLVLVEIMIEMFY